MLRVPLDRAREIVEERVATGELLAGHLSNPMLIITPQPANDVLAQHETWVHVTGVALESICTTDLLSIQFWNSGRSYARNALRDNQITDLTRASDNVQNRLNMLRAIRESLRFYNIAAEEPPEKPTKQPVAPPGPVNITVQGGTIGTINTGQVSGQIKSNVQHVTGPSAEEFRSIVEAVTAAIKGDAGLTEEDRATALQWMEILTEQAVLPAADRKAVLVKTALESLPGFLSAAQTALPTFQLYLPQLIQFFGLQ
jgi:hypothetical protein